MHCSVCNPLHYSDMIDCNDPDNCETEEDPSSDEEMWHYANQPNDVNFVGPDEAAREEAPEEDPDYECSDLSDTEC